MRIAQLTQLPPNRHAAHPSPGGGQLFHRRFSVPVHERLELLGIWNLMGMPPLVAGFCLHIACRVFAGHPRGNRIAMHPKGLAGFVDSQALLYCGYDSNTQIITVRTRHSAPLSADGLSADRSIRTRPLWEGLYYAFKQSESDGNAGTASTGWETFLDAVIRAGFALGGTWPIRTERQSRSRGIASNALASSIVLVCRPRAADAPTATRREFLTALRRELPEALAHLQHGNIAPVDLQQSAIGPGMAVFTRYANVLNAEGKAMRVREALALINQNLDEVLAEQEGDFDADTRWALSWFDQFGFAEGEYGVAETLSKAKNTSVSGMVEAGILASKSGKVRLLKPDELPRNWDPTTDTRLTVWEMVHQLVRTLEQGETSAAELVAKLGAKADTARELSYRLFTICERRKHAQEALSYNALVQSWPEIARLARDNGASRPAVQAALFEENQE